MYFLLLLLLLLLFGMDRSHYQKQQRQQQHHFQLRVLDQFIQLYSQIQHHLPEGITLDDIMFFGRVFNHLANVDPMLTIADVETIDP